MKFIKTIKHPKAKTLKVAIMSVEEDAKTIYFFDDNGDGYTSLNECIKDAKDSLEYDFCGDLSMSITKHLITKQQERYC